MNLVKCPRCDLNYILDTEKYCKICLREMKGNHVEDEMEMCSVCNAAPALPGRDVCLSCLKEMNGHAGSDSDVEENQAVVDESTIGLNSMSNMEEIIPQIDDDDDFADLDGDLSLESVIEEEENEEDEDEDEE